MKVKVRRELVKRIIRACEYVVKRGSDPFEVEVRKYIDELREFLDRSDSPEDLVLDLDAFERISRIVELQGDWINSKSSKLYYDPLLIEWKLKSLDLKSLGSIFVSAFFPITSLRLFSVNGVESAVDYWVKLPPLKERWGRLPEYVVGTALTSLEDLIRNKLALEGSFSDMVETFWVELKEKSSAKKVYYWDFVSSESYVESLLKAYLLSFLVTYGYAYLEFDVEVKDYLVVPYEDKQNVDHISSVAIPLSYDDWVRRMSHESKKD